MEEKLCSSKQYGLISLILVIKLNNFISFSEVELMVLKQKSVRSSDFYPNINTTISCSPKIIKTSATLI